MTHLHSFHPNLWLTELQLDIFDVRGAVICGAERAVVWDTLSHPRDMQPVLPLLTDLPTYIVYTHADWDHCWGTIGVPQHQLILAQEACRARFASDVPETLREKQSGEPERWQEVVLIPPTLTFPTHLTLDLGGLTLELHHLPGHTLDCIVGFIPELGILLAGDTVETPLPVVNEDSPLDLWLEQLQRWYVDPRVQTVIPAHGAIGGRELIHHNITYLSGLRSGTATAPESMPDFYQETHAANQRYAGRETQP